MNWLSRLAAWLFGRKPQCEHDWAEVTALDDPHATHYCRKCPAVKREPRT